MWGLSVKTAVGLGVCPACCLENCAPFTWNKTGHENAHLNSVCSVDYLHSFSLCYLFSVCSGSGVICLGEKPECFVYLLQFAPPKENLHLLTPTCIFPIQFKAIVLPKISFTSSLNTCLLCLHTVRHSFDLAKLKYWQMLRDVFFFCMITARQRFPWFINARNKYLNRFNSFLRDSVKAFMNVMMRCCTETSSHHFIAIRQAVYWYRKQAFSESGRQQRWLLMLPLHRGFEPCLRLLTAKHQFEKIFNLLVHNATWDCSFVLFFGCFQMKSIFSSH